MFITYRTNFLVRLTPVWQKRIILRGFFQKTGSKSEMFSKTSLVSAHFSSNRRRSSTKPKSKLSSKLISTAEQFWSWCCRWSQASVRTVLESRNLETLVIICTKVRPMEEGSGCSTAVEHATGDKEVVGLNPARCCAFFFSILSVMCP